MATYNRYPKPYDQILCEAFTLPGDATPLIMTNTATIDAAESGEIWVRVFAGSAQVEITNPLTITFVPVVGTTTTEVATWTGGGHRLPGTIVSAITASIFGDTDHNTTWASGEMICEFALPMSFIRTLNTSDTKHNYLAVYVVCSGSVNDDNIEAYLYIE